MSIYHLAQKAVDRLANGAFRPPIAAAPAAPPPPAAAPAAANINGVSSAIAGLTKYIPTETVTLYVATLSAQGALRNTFGQFEPAWAYWIFLGFTPVLAIILFFRQLKLNPPLPGSTSPGIPWWAMTAGTIAFAVWALAVPQNGVLPAGSETLAAFGALVVSTLLNLVAPLFETRP